jgi:hypothetical protein
MQKLDSKVQDARALLKTARKYEAGEVGDGIDAGLVTQLAGAIEQAVASDTTQRNSFRDVGRLTDAQDKAMANARLFIRKAQNAAKGCYGSKDALMMKEFRVGAKPSNAVKVMVTDLAYLKGVAEKRVGDLAKFGFKAADLSTLATAAAELERIDALQELSKKYQKNATQQRDDAVKNLMVTMQKVRSTAKSVFIGQKDVLTEFESVLRAKPKKKTATVA